ncbi:hypothetical protein [Streptomyces rubrogriseus]|uniref:hypothetical protein n=1 Tax=Streptomyces rubrogriseus TaxID=194673 RepID=UPI0037D8E92C
MAAARATITAEAPVLLPLLNDSDPAVRITAAYALATAADLDHTVRTALALRSHGVRTIDRRVATSERQQDTMPEKSKACGRASAGPAVTVWWSRPTPAPGWVSRRRPSEHHGPTLALRQSDGLSSLTVVLMPHAEPCVEQPRGTT